MANGNGNDNKTAVLAALVQVAERLGLPTVFLLTFGWFIYTGVLQPLSQVAVENIQAQTNILLQMSTDVMVTRAVVEADQNENKKELIGEIKSILKDHERTSCTRTESIQQRLMRHDEDIKRIIRAN